MSNYTPKPGDGVKATFNDNVIYGEVDDPRGTSTGPEFIRVLPEGGTYVLELPLSDFVFEPWVKPVTFKPLTVVRLAVDAPSVMFTHEPYWTDADREPFETPVTIYRYAENEWTAVNGLVDLSDTGIGRALAHGKAEILFEGVDE